MEQQPAQPMQPMQAAPQTPNYMVPTSSKSKTTALLLCIFLGGIGVHRFYVGKIGTGVLYIFTCACFGIGWIVDIIKIATGTFTDAAGVALRK